MRIFVVEDQKIILQGIRKMIEGFGLDQVYTYSDASKALSELQLMRPDVVLTDIVMEGMDGLSMIQEARRLLPECHFVIISGFADFEYAQQAILLGVDRYLLKPIDRAQLEETLKSLRGSGQEDVRRSISEEVMVYVRAHSEQPLSIAEIASNIHIAPNYLSNVFKKETGISVSEAIRSEQMKAAARLLRSSSLYLYEIAEKFGYKDVKYFSAIFKNYYNMTPKSYRKQYQTEIHDE